MKGTSECFCTREVKKRSDMETTSQVFSNRDKYFWAKSSNTCISKYILNYSYVLQRCGSLEHMNTVANTVYRLPQEEDMVINTKNKYAIQIRKFFLLQKMQSQLQHCQNIRVFTLVSSSSLSHFSLCYFPKSKCFFPHLLFLIQVQKYKKYIFW